MLGVAALLASSSMAAIELITLYARLDNAVHKNAPPPHTHLRKHTLPNSPLLPSSHAATARHSPQKRLESCSRRTRTPPLLSPANNEETLLLCRAGVA